MEQVENRGVMQEILTGKQKSDGFSEKWEVKSFSQLFKFLNTANNPWSDLSDFGDVRYIHYGDIHTTKTISLNCATTDLPMIAKIKVTNIPFIKEGDLVMVDASEDYSGIGKCVEIHHVGDKKIVAGLHTFLLRGNNEQIADGFKSYLQFIPNVKASMIRLATGISVYGISKNNVKRIEILVPCIKEQRNISQILSDTDELIKQLDYIITKKKIIKQEIMQELLTGKRRLLGFKDDWIDLKLGHIAEIKDGTHQTPKYIAHGVPFYSVENVTNDNFSNTKYISEQDHKILTKTFKIEKGDILMTRIGSIGDCKLIDWDVNASFYVSLALLKIKENTSSGFIYQYSKSSSFKKEVEGRSLLWAVPKKINLGDISKINVYIPPTKEEQFAITKILADMDIEINELEKNKNKYLMIKNGMMQKLLTGEIRVK